MREGLCRLAVFAAVLAVLLVVVPRVRAEPPGGRTYLGPYSVYNSDLTALKPSYVGVPSFTSVRLQTTVSVPDGGAVTLGGSSRLSEGRTEFGTPVLGKVPGLDRGFRNTGYGRDVQASRVVVGARVIVLEEEEYRQTGVRSGR